METITGIIVAILIIRVGGFAGLMMVFWWDDNKHVFDNKWYKVPVFFVSLPFYMIFKGFMAICEVIDDFFFYMKYKIMDLLCR